ncbi:MAG: S41 family peptidase [Candidatus Rhabdochlamydia sp.]
MKKIQIPFLFFLLFLFNFHPVEALLSPLEASHKLAEILKAHALYHELNEKLITRSIDNFLQELDPHYGYLLEEDVHPWMTASSEQIQVVLKELRQKNFRFYQEMYQLMIKGIERRRLIEKEIAHLVPVENVKAEEFKDLTWAATEDDLKTRLHRIHSLQLQTAQKILTPQEQSQLKARLEKRRLRKEEMLLEGSYLEQTHTFLTYVLKALSSALDSQTAYFTPKEAGQLMMQVQQQLYGIGAQLRDDLNGLTITRILEGSPLSYQPDIKIGDQIIAVNHTPIIGLEITDAVELIRGPRGTAVTLTLLRQQAADSPLQFTQTLNRDKIVLKENQFELALEPFGQGVIGILKLHSFYQDQDYSSGSDLLEEINQLKKNYLLKGIILDLRGNTGGLLPQAVAVASLFMKQGVVVSVKDHTGFIQKLRNLNPITPWEGPLIILTDRLTASASEIVAQTLQEYGRAVVIGDAETFGKGTFQTFTLDSSRADRVNAQGEYKVTRGCYYTVSGRSPQKTGVKADIVVPGIFSLAPLGERYAKYALEPDTISASFYDDLSDIPLIHRHQIRKLYHQHQQPISSEYNPYLTFLLKNSKQRINHPIASPASLSEGEDLASSSLEHKDLQQQEAINIMKDLIFMNNAHSHTAKRIKTH